MGSEMCIRDRSQRPPIHLYFSIGSSCFLLFSKFFHLLLVFCMECWLHQVYAVLNSWLSIYYLIKQHNPNFVAIESPFFGKNVQSKLKLGRAQGVSMAAALNLDIPITEYSPKKIKMAITGNGNSSKEQVARMLNTMLDIKEMPKNLDSTDG